MIDQRRVQIIHGDEHPSGAVVYWMNRDQRLSDNWALLHAQNLAIGNAVPLALVFVLTPWHRAISSRQWTFMLDGLKQLANDADKFQLPFYMLTGDAGKVLPRFMKENGIGTLITDFSPLREHRRDIQQVSKTVVGVFHEVDAHNIVPVRSVSNKQEFAAYTIRPKIQRQLDEFLQEFPRLKKHPIAWDKRVPAINWDSLRNEKKTTRVIREIVWLAPGETAAQEVLANFLSVQLSHYNDRRNDPNTDAQSHLSPYLHFGQIAPQRAALKAQRFGDNIASQEAFLEELIIRRELSDNYCYYNDHYDTIDGFPEWARKTLNEHRTDPRESVYTQKQFENAETHDALWNAAQREMVCTGKMHGYMRMYWAKKILEWSATPEDALAVAIDLNDAYELDGRDANGYAGIAWSIGGVHDRAWGERDIFGKIRYMSMPGCRRKFDVAEYVRRMDRIATEDTR
ncbi:MAG: deoxyribodipyrimidine photo-lyase [candidate division Zixibacteria bacterium]|nr:deoxyribodipyrimidine photo-lyase [candidate division Zixibacteria bacterium]